MTPGARLLFAARQAASPFAARPTAPQSPAHRRSLQRAALAALAIVVLGGGGTPARAETSATFGVAARIDAGCLVDGLGSSGDAGTMGTLDFGSDMSLSTATHTASASAAQTIRLRCTPGTALLMTIDGGEHEAGGVRYLQHGADSGARIAYSLCSDGSCAAPIAVGAATPVTVLDANSEDIRLPLYGRLTLPGALPPGLYNDRLVEARLEEGARSVPLAPGLLGYVLAGSRARWPLPEGAPHARLSAGVNGGERQMLAPADE